MVLLGVIVNTLAIIVGTLLGIKLTRVPEKMKSALLKVLGIAVLVLGLEMALKAEYFLIVLASLIFGTLMGEWLQIEDHLDRMGRWIELKVGENRGEVARAFVTATLVFNIGAMAVIGSLNSGLHHDHNILYTKAFLDGLFSVIVASTLGYGVIFSALPVFLYQGSIALLATSIERWVPTELLDRLVTDMTATGGMMIMAIGLNLMGLTEIKVGNLLPGLVLAILFGAGFYLVQL